MLTDSEEEPSPPPCDYRRREWWNPLLVNREDYVPEHKRGKTKEEAAGRERVVTRLRSLLGYLWIHKCTVLGYIVLPGWPTDKLVSYLHQPGMHT